MKAFVLSMLWIGWPMALFIVIDPPSPVDPPRPLSVLCVGFLFCAILLVAAARKSSNRLLGRAALIGLSVWVAAWSVIWMPVRNSLVFQLIQIRDREVRTLRVLGVDVRYSWGFRHWLVACKGPSWDDSRIEQVIAELVHLEAFDLNLQGSSVTDHAIRQLCGLRGLRSLDVRQTAISDGAIAEVRRAIPGLYIKSQESRETTSDRTNKCSRRADRLGTKF
jgi:hypothetical protein